jgi:hypothetical protein
MRPSAKRKKDPNSASGKGEETEKGEEKAQDPAAMRLELDWEGKEKGSL